MRKQHINVVISTSTDLSGLDGIIDVYFNGKQMIEIGQMWNSEYESVCMTVKTLKEILKKVDKY